jgi:hypothetical protein
VLKSVSYTDHDAVLTGAEGPEAQLAAEKRRKDSKTAGEPTAIYSSSQLACCKHCCARCDSPVLLYRQWSWQWLVTA